MEIKSERMKRCELVTVSGRIDSASAPHLEQTLMELIQSGQKNIAVNLSGADYISSSGMKALLAALIKARKAIPPGNVVIAEIKPELRESFDLVGLDRLFTFYDQDAQAVGAF
jgi:anti-anti-sigma factor